MRTDNQPHPTTEDENTPATIGSTLRHLREQKGLEIQQVSEVTRIAISNLLAIEAEQYEQLPADAFLRGLVSIYGNFLGLDGSEISLRFIKERNLQRPKGKKNKPTKIDHSLTPKKLAEPSNISSATIAGILFLCIVISFIVVCLYTGWNPFSSFLNRIQPSSPQGIFSTIEGRQSGMTAAPQISPALLPVHPRESKKTGVSGEILMLSHSNQPTGGD